MSTLVIVESPAKAKTIEKYLGKEYKVKSSIGHVRDLPKSNKDAVDIEAGFVPKYIVSPGKEKVIKDLKNAAKKADQVLLASDPDREGEAIAWHVAELIKGENKNLKRIVFHEITEPAVAEALKHPRSIDDNLRVAQEARRVLDRLIGYDLSGLIWKKVRYGLSVGRVQSPALRILMERERLIRAFIPHDYWVLEAHTKHKDQAIIFTGTEEPTEKNTVDRIVATGKKYPWQIKQVKETEIKRPPRPPFITSTLQQVASTRLGFSPSRTMGAAQKLYEAGHITYMRTDSTTISELAKKQIIALLHKEYGNDYVSPRNFKTKSKSAQEAHEAIRPSNFAKRSVGSTTDQKMLYELIWCRAVASQMTEAKLKRTKLVANVIGADEPIPDFAVNGSRVIFDGYLAIDTASRGEDVEVPKVAAQDALTLKEMTVTKKQTQPLGRYSEAGLIKELEKRGIGRPSTYATTIKTIIKRDYVKKEGHTLIPTDTGDVVSSFLEEHFTNYIDDNFTSQMEDTLDEIAIGQADYKKTLTDFYEPFHQAVMAKEDIVKLTNLGPAPDEFTCPECGNKMVIKLGRNGKFLSCDNYPECTGARMINDTELKSDEPLGQDSETGEDIYLLQGRFGPYVQMGKTPEKVKGKKIPAPKRASVPKDKPLDQVSLADATHYLKLPRELGNHPDTGESIKTNIGRFGPYIEYVGDFRSLKKPDDPYTISLRRALAILKEPKKLRAGEKLVKEVGLNPKTKKMIKVFESKSGRYLKRGFKRIWLPDGANLDTFSVADALALAKK